mmetsp:Transcript_11050/g.33005  ORF Transcript_11050/g.33005 Transcript_11050/m.33005 type:complete len:223 (-) Transcript_11050:2966-3634(-)
MAARWSSSRRAPCPCHAPRNRRRNRRRNHTHQTHRICQPGSMHCSSGDYSIATAPATRVRTAASTTRFSTASAMHQSTTRPETTSSLTRAHCASWELTSPPSSSSRRGAASTAPWSTTRSQGTRSKCEPPATATCERGVSSSQSYARLSAPCKSLSRTSSCARRPASTLRASRCAKSTLARTAKRRSARTRCSTTRSTATVSMAWATGRMRTTASARPCPSL